MDIILNTFRTTNFHQLRPHLVCFPPASTQPQNPSQVLERPPLGTEVLALASPPRGPDRPQPSILETCFQDLEDFLPLQLKGEFINDLFTVKAYRRLVGHGYYVIDRVRLAVNLGKALRRAVKGKTTERTY